MSIRPGELSWELINDYCSFLFSFVGDIKKTPPHWDLFVHHASMVVALVRQHASLTKTCFTEPKAGEEASWMGIWKHILCSKRWMEWPAVSEEGSGRSARRSMRRRGSLHISPKKKKSERSASCCYYRFILKAKSLKKEITITAWFPKFWGFKVVLEGFIKERSWTQAEKWCSAHSQSWLHTAKSHGL